MNKVHIFHHVDNDGMVAGYWAYNYFSDVEHVHEFGMHITLHPINYGWPFPFEEIEKDDIVVIVDFSLEDPDDMMKLLTEYTNRVIWIDHHITSINKYNDFPFNIPGIRYSGIAACVLTWYYFKQINIDAFLRTGEGLGETILIPSDKMPVEDMRKSIYSVCPTGTMHFADNDIWEFENPNTKRFVAGAGALSLSSDEDIDRTQNYATMKKYDDGYERTLADGDIAIKTKRDMYDVIMKCAGFPCHLINDDESISSLKCFACNSAVGNSEIFGSAYDNYDVCIKWYQTPYGYTYTLYSKAINVSKIALSYGGGGHVGAAGCKSDTLIFEWDTDKE